MVNYRKKRGRTSHARARQFAFPAFSVEKVAIWSFIGAAMLFGGAGLAYPLLSWLVIASAVLVIWVMLGKQPWAFQPSLVKAAVALAGAFAVLFTLQSVPVPLPLWQAMPGHDIAVTIAQASGLDAWRSWSLAPDRTLTTILSLLPPLAAVLAIAGSSQRTRILLVRLVVAAGLFNAVLGIVQYASGTDAALLYVTRHRGVAVGLFVNRNHTALFLLVTMLLTVLPGVIQVSGRMGGPAVQSIRAGITALLALAVLATMSRAGFFLLPASLIVAWMLGRQVTPKVRTIVLAVGGAAVAVGLLSLTPPARELAGRYVAASEDKRFDYWTNSSLAMHDALPWGTGAGTFRLVYPTVEPLREVAPDVVNHAHNDYLELLLEAGIPGIALLLAGFALVIAAVARARRNSQSRFDRRVALAAGAGFVLIAASSLVDYPVRMDAIAVLGGMLLGLLLPEPAESASSISATPFVRVAATLVLVAGLAGATAIRWSEHFALAGRPELAVRLQPWSSHAWSQLADKLQIAGQPQKAGIAAAKALALSPTDAGALRALAATKLQTGDIDQGAELMSLGARLGWRDLYTQLWLVEQALAAGVYDVGVQRADAVLRQNKFFEQMLGLLPPLLKEKAGRRALADQLANAPGWRPAFFNTVARSPDYRLEELLELFADLRARRSGVTPAETELIRSALAQQGRFADVRRVWQGSGGQGNIGDPHFDRKDPIPGFAAPYRWKALSLLGVSMQPGTPSPQLAGRALALSSDGVAEGPALAQTIAVLPGTYRISLSVLARDQALPGKLAIGVVCRVGDAAGTRAPVGAMMSWKPHAGQWTSGQGRLTVPADCPGQDLYIGIPRSDTGPFSLWIDEVSLERLSGS